MSIENRKLALQFAREAGVTEPSSQKLQKFLELCAEHFLSVGAEVMRERCAEKILYNERYLGTLGAVQHAKLVSDIPGVTLEDLK